MSDIQQWFYIDASGQQVGPATADQLQQLATDRQISAETNVWTEGLETWVPATQVEGLIPTESVQPVQPVAPAVNPYTQPSAATVTAAAGGDYPIPLTPKANFKLYLSLYISGAILLIIGMVKNAMDAPTAEEMMANSEALQEPGYLGLALLIIGALLLIVPSILNLVFLYRAWFLIQPGGASISPGKAIGFLFIPIFGAIWMWIVLFKLPGEWNNIVSRYTNTTGAPRMSIGTVFCLMFIPFIGTIIWAAELSKAINFMVSARIAPQQQQPVGNGALRLY